MKKKQRLTIDLDKECHTALKILSAKEGVSATSIINTLVRKFLVTMNILSK